MRSELSMKTREIILSKRPTSRITPDLFSIREKELPPLLDDQVIVRILYVSVDPYLRGKMNEGKSYTSPFELNAPLYSRAIGEVIESKSNSLKKGDYVSGMLNWAEHVVALAENLSILDESNEESLKHHLYLLGMPGLTAYIGLLKIGQPTLGETLVISGAAGAVGMVVGQIGKMKGCHVVGITSTAAKAKTLIEEYGFDEVVLYPDEANFESSLKKACPSGIDIYFDNVGGWISDAVSLQLNFHSRYILCGQISQYNSEIVEVGPRVLPHFLTRSVLLKGFIVGDYSEYYTEATSTMRAWINQGRLKQAETVVQGFETIPQALIDLFEGVNIGKLLVSLKE